MKRLLFIAICFCMALSVSAGKKKDFVDYSYELTYVKDVPASTVGFTVFKVWSYGKKKELLTKDICMRNAVHGLLFKGLAANYSGKQGNVPPLCPEGYQAHKEYFDRRRCNQGQEGVAGWFARAGQSQRIAQTHGEGWHYRRSTQHLLALILDNSRCFNVNR